MNKKFLKPKLYNCLFLSTGVLFSIFLAGRGIAMDNKTIINRTLNINTTSKDVSDDAIYFSSTYNNDADVKNYVKEVATEAEGEGLVLLKNENNALPLKTNEKISLFGASSVNFNYNATGSSGTDSSKYGTLKDALTNVGFTVNQTLLDFYSTGVGKDYGRVTSGNLYTINEVPFDKYDEATLNSINDSVAIVTLSRESGEGKDISTARSDGEDGSYLSLSNQELDLLKNLTTFKNQNKIKKIVVLLNSSNMIEQDYLYREGIDVDAVMWVGNVGAYGLNGVAKALNGDINPSGRLSDTLCRDNFSSPAMANWKLNNNKSFASGYTNYKAAKLDSSNRSYGVYNEGIYVGYRYYETRYEDAMLNNGNTSEYVYDNDVAFPFGYGLSYTTFDYTSFNVTPSSDGNSYTIIVKVKNTGEVKGKHAVTIYMQKPYTSFDKTNGVEKASVELAGFAKTSEINPGEEEEVSITIKKSQFKTYDSFVNKTYILEKGDYYLSLGADSHNAINNILLNKNVDSSKIKDDAADKGFAYKINIAEDDLTTYSTSEYTGEKITNQLDHADMNKYDGRGDNSVTYISRNDWESTWPKSKISFTATEKMIEDFKPHKALPTDGIMPTYDSGELVTVASLRGEEFDSENWDRLLNSMSQKDQIKLVTAGHLSTAGISSVALPDTTEADGPTAVTSTKTDSSFPSEGIWASSFNLELIQKVGDAFAEDIINSDTDGIYAPGVNIHRTPFGGRSNEYFSEDPLLTGLAASYEIIGLQKKGIVTHVKHFAFNECETERSGIGIWLNEQEAREIMLLPFELAVTVGDSGAIMNSFNRAGCLWTGADKNLSINILQKEWGFKGYAITDMASSNGGLYMVYDDAYMGGSNLFLSSENSLDEYKDNAAFCEKVRDSAHRILYTICNKSIAMNGLKSDSVVLDVTPWWEILVNTFVITFGIIATITLVMTIVSEILLKRE